MDQKTQPKTVGRMERFERFIVFRVARGYFFLMAIVAVVGLVVGSFALGSSFMKIPIERPEEPPAIPPPEPITLQALEQWMAQVQNKASRPAESVYEDKAPAKPGDAQVRRQQISEMEGLVEQLRGLFPQPQYAWDDAWEDYCRVPSQYGCIQRDHRMVRDGVSKLVRAALQGLDRQEAIAVLKVMIGVLTPAPVEQRQTLLNPVVQYFKTVNEAYLEKIHEREAAISQAQTEYEERLSSQKAFQQKRRDWGMYGAAGGLALLILVSLFLAHFAIERHLRLMQELVASLKPPSPATSVAAEPPKG